MKRLAFGYCRVSTLGQVEDGTSLEVQAEKISQLASLRGWELVIIYRDEGVSGQSVRRRRQLREALKAVCEAQGVLVFYDLSRLARNTGDALAICDQLRAAGADLASCTEPFDSTASGRLMFEMLAAFAAYFARVSGEKISAANARQVRLHGYRTQGRQAYGFKIVDGLRVPIEAEQAVIREARKLRRSLSFEKTAGALNDLGHRTRLGRPWYAASVMRIVGRVKRPTSATCATTEAAI